METQNICIVLFEVGFKDIWTWWCFFVWVIFYAYIWTLNNPFKFGFQRCQVFRKKRWDWIIVQMGKKCRLCERNRPLDKSRYSLQRNEIEIQVRWPLNDLDIKGKVCNQVPFNSVEWNFYNLQHRYSISSDQKCLRHHLLKISHGNFTLAFFCCGGTFSVYTNRSRNNWQG